MVWLEHFEVAQNRGFLIMGWPAPLEAVGLGSLTFDRGRGADRWTSWCWGSISARTAAAWSVWTRRDGSCFAGECGGRRSPGLLGNGLAASSRWRRAAVRIIWAGSSPRRATWCG